MDITGNVPASMGRLMIGRATALIIDRRVLPLGEWISVGGQKGFLLGFIAWSPSHRVRFICIFLFSAGLKLCEGLGGGRAWFHQIYITDREHLLGSTPRYPPRIC